MELMKTTAKINVYYKTINAYVSPDIGRYYRALMPKYYTIQPPRSPSHISVVRAFEGWNSGDYKRFDNATVDIYYKPVVKTCGLYFWIDAWSEDIREIRNALGLPDYIGRFDRYHITIGNTKNELQERRKNSYCKMSSLPGQGCEF